MAMLRHCSFTKSIVCVCSPMVAFLRECNVKMCLIGMKEWCWSFFYLVFFLEHCQPNIINHYRENIYWKFFTFWIKWRQIQNIELHQTWRERESICVMRSNRQIEINELSIGFHIVLHFGNTNSETTLNQLFS